MRTPGRGICLIFVLTFGNGCSALFVRSQGSARYGPGGCTSRRFVPALDAGISVFATLQTLDAARASDAGYHPSTSSRGADVGLGATAAIIFGASALYGFSVLSGCEEESPGPNAGSQAPKTHEQRAAEEAAEEAAVQKRMRAQSAAAAGNAAPDAGAADVRD
jgi:hypothetical protein